MTQEKPKRRMTMPKWTEERKAARSAAMKGKKQGPRPSHRNTVNAENFLIHFLYPFLIQLQEIEEAEDVSAFNTEEFTFHRSERYGTVNFNFSITELRGRYGRAADEIWRKMFYKLRSGGMDANRNAFASLWTLNREARTSVFGAHNKLLTRRHFLTPTEVLQLLDRFDVLSAQHTQTLIIHDQDGHACVRPLGYRKLVTEEKRVELREQRRRKQRVADARNAENKEQIEAARAKRKTLTNQTPISDESEATDAVAALQLDEIGALE